MNKSGAGTWILSAANTFTGGATISGGSLQLNNSFALQNDSVTISSNNGLTFAAGLGSATIFGLNGNNAESLNDTASGGVMLNVVGYQQRGGDTGGDSNSYSGVLSGNGGLSVNTNGTQTFSQANTYLGATFDIGGVLRTTLSTTGGSPFGVGTMNLNGGTLQLAPGGSGVQVSYTGSQALSGSALIYGGGQSTLQLRKGGNPSVTYTVGGGGTAAIGRANNGLLLINPSSATTLASSEFFKVNGAFPTVANGGIVNGMVNPSIAGEGTSSNAFDFLTYDPTNGFEVATYNTPLTGAGVTYAASAGNVVYSAPSSGTNTITGSAYALVVSGSTTISGTVNIGDNTAGHQAGVILNQSVGTTMGGIINFGASAGVVYYNGGYGGNPGVPFAGTGGVTFGGNGGGPESLTSGSTFTGGVTLTSGITLGNSNSLSDSSFGSISNTITWNGGAINGNLNGINFSTSRQMIIGAAGANWNISNSNILFAGNIISGTGVITFVAGGANNPAILTGNNTYGGLFFNQGGYLDVASDANLGGANTPISFYTEYGGDSLGFGVMGTQLTGFGSHRLVASGPGTITLDIENPNNIFNLNQAFGGNTLAKSGQGTLLVTAPFNASTSPILNGGTLKVDYSQGGSLGASGAPVFAGGALWILGQSAGITNQTVGNVTVNSGGGTLRVDTNGASNAFNLTLGTLGANTTAGATLNIASAGGGTANITTTTTTSGLTNGILSGRYVYNGGDWAAVTTATANNLISAYSGYTTVAASASPSGTDSNNSLLTSASGSSGSVTLGGTWTTNSLKIAGGSTLDLGGNTLTLTSGGLLFTGSGAYTIQDGTLNAGTGSNGTNTDVIIQDYGAGTLTINSTIGAGTGSQTLTVAGSGTVALGAAINSYTGATYINGATLKISSFNQLSAGAINLNGGTLLYSGSSVSTGLAINDGGSGGTIDVVNNAVLTVNSTISGGGLTLASDDGTGFLVLNASNTFINGLYINSGTLRLANANALSGGSPGPNSNSNPVVFGSAGKLQLNGQSPTIMGLSSASTTAAIVENGNNSSTAVTLTVNTGDNETFAGTIQNGTTSDGTHGGLSLVTGGGGTWSLTGSNTFTGSVQLLNGTLNLGSANACSTSVTASQTANGVANNIVFGPTASGTAIANGGVLQYTSASASMDYSARIKNSAAPIAIDTNNQSVTFGSALASSNIGGLNKIGLGTLTLTGANAYTGPTTLTLGTLRVNSPGSLASGSPVIVNGGILNGNGTINGTVTVNNTGTLAAAGTINGAVAINAGGILSPGNIDGSSALTINNTLSLAGVTNIGMSAASPSSGVITGNNIAGVTSITYGGSLNFTVSPSIFTDDTKTYTLQIFPSGATETGTFSSFVEPDLTSAGMKWGSFNYTTGSSGPAGSIEIIPVVAPKTSGDLFAGVERGLPFCARWRGNQHHLDHHQLWRRRQSRLV